MLGRTRGVADTVQALRAQQREGDRAVQRGVVREKDALLPAVTRTLLRSGASWSSSRSARTVLQSTSFGEPRGGRPRGLRGGPDLGRELVGLPGLLSRMIRLHDG